jgi:hypothetical protein
VRGTDGALRLPSGPLAPSDRTLDLALRRFAREQAAVSVGYVEQLYTFGDLGRAGVAATEGRLLSIAYLALVRESPVGPDAVWADCYELLPWEDLRDGRPPMLLETIAPALQQWVAAAARGDERDRREERAHVTFGLNGSAWDGVRVLERYELLYEVGLLAEARRRGRTSERLGLPMALDHRRMVATALGRVRGKLSYRPLVFELLPDSFTLSQLQHLVEALAGVRLHKQNFRRLVESAGLVEGTGESAPSGGRPAELFRFRREVVRERPRPGVGGPWARS